MNQTGQERLAQLIALVDKEDRHLTGVRRRLLGSECSVDAARLSALLDDENGIDRLESFGAEFGRMQDTAVRGTVYLSL